MLKRGENLHKSKKEITKNVIPRLISKVFVFTSKFIITARLSIDLRVRWKEGVIQDFFPET